MSYPPRTGSFAPLLNKLAQGREISGLGAYEQ